jgi:C1A family cysteine protease
MKNTGKHIDVSRLFIYYNSRKKDGLQEYNMQDNGTHIKNAVAALAEFGCCKENLYPYKAPNVNQKPPPHCYSVAKNYRITGAMQVDVNLNEMKRCLAEGYPFAFGIQTFPSFLQAGKYNGSVPMPQPHLESQNQQHGWHAMLAVGYSDRSQCFIVKNSWGPKWVSFSSVFVRIHLRLK